MTDVKNTTAGVERKATSDEIKKVLEEEEKKKRIENCVKELEGILAKYNCGLVAQVIITGEGNKPSITVVAK